MPEETEMPETAFDADEYPMMPESKFGRKKSRRSMMSAKPAMFGGAFLILLVITALIFVSLNLIVDMMYSVLDPKVKLH